MRTRADSIYSEGDGEFAWSCSLGLTYPIEAFTEAAARLPDDEALEMLRALPELRGHGIGGHGLLNGHLECDPSDLIDNDVILFDRVFNDRGRRRVNLRMTTPALPLPDLKDRLSRFFFSVHEAGEIPRGVPYLKEAMAGSRAQESCFVLHHPELNLTSNSGDLVGLDAAWTAMFPSIGVAPMARSIFLTRLDWRMAQGELVPPEALDAGQLRDRSVQNLSRVSAEQGTLTFRGIPTGLLIDQIKQMHVDRSTTWTYAMLAARVEDHLFDKDLVTRGSEQRRIGRVRAWMDAEDALKFVTVPSGVRISFDDIVVARWDAETGRLDFTPTHGGRDDRKVHFRSHPITRDEVETVFAGMILDAVWGRDLIDHGSHRKSWLGPMADSFRPVYDQMLSFSETPGSISQDAWTVA